MTRQEKAAEIELLTSKVSKAKAMFLVDYKGMSVESMTALRKKLSPAESELKVVRNTLAKRSLFDFPASKDALSSSLSGTNAVVFSYGDVTASAKTLTEFAKDVEQLQIKTGVLDGTVLDPERIKALASLPSKDVLRAQLLGMMSAPMSTFVRVLNAVPSGFVRACAAYNEKREQA